MTRHERNSMLFAISVAVIVGMIVVLILTRFVCVLMVGPLGERVTNVESTVNEHEVRIDALEVNVSATIKQIAEYQQRRASIATQ